MKFPLNDTYSRVKTCCGDMSRYLTPVCFVLQMLIKMKTTWDEMEMEILPYKEGRGLRCRVPDDLFQVLEDNQVGLQTMKASRWVTQTPSPLR